MPNVKGLLSDPQFNSLDSATQKSVLAGIDPQFGGISDSDFATFRQSVGSAAPTLRMPTPPTWMDKLGNAVGVQNILQGVDAFGKSIGDLTNSKTPLSERLGNVFSNIPIVGQPLTESAHALARLYGAEPQVQGGSAVRDVLRAVPGGSMIQQPVEDAAAGRYPEAVGGAAMLALGLAGRGNSLRYEEPIQPVEQAARNVWNPKTKQFETPTVPVLPEIHPGVKAAAEWTLPVPYRVQRLLGHAYDAVRENTSKVAPAPTRMMDVTPFNIGEPEPRPAYQPLPALPGLKQDSVALPSDGLPSKRQVGGIQNIPPPRPPIVRVPGGVIPDRPADASPIVPWSPPEATPAPLSAPVELPSGRKPGGIQNQTAGSPLAPAASDIAGIHPMDLEAAASLMSNGKKAFADLKGPARAEAITRARQFTTNRSPAAPAPLAPRAAQPATSPVTPRPVAVAPDLAPPVAHLPALVQPLPEMTQPGSIPLRTRLAENGMLEPLPLSADTPEPLQPAAGVATPLERQLQASLLSAQMPKEPITPIGNNIVYPDNVHPQLHPAGPDVAITHAINASAKDLAVARRLQSAGITPEALDRMSDDALNQHYTALGYKKLGSDFGPGKRVGRDAATGRAHLRQVLSEMQ